MLRPGLEEGGDVPSPCHTPCTRGICGSSQPNGSCGLPPLVEKERAQSQVPASGPSGKGAGSANAGAGTARVLKPHQGHQRHCHQPAGRQESASVEKAAPQKPCKWTEVRSMDSGQCVRTAGKHLARGAPGNVTDTVDSRGRAPCACTEVVGNLSDGAVTQQLLAWVA